MTDTQPAADRRDKIDALLDVAKFNPLFTGLIVMLGLGAALLEGIGIGFILPIIELLQADDPSGKTGPVIGVFRSVYGTLGIPFTLGFVTLGVVLVITPRYLLSFSVAWFREALRTNYLRDLQLRAFDHALAARIEYFDHEGTDDVLNAIITQTFYAGRVIARVAQFLEQVFLSLVYLLVAVLIAPVLAVLSMAVLGGMTYIVRDAVEPGYELGDTVADANERRQAAAQAGTQGIRDIRIFNLAEELMADFTEAVDTYTSTRISIRRNEAAIQNVYNWMVAVSVFGLIYVSLTFFALSLGELSVFLFAMFRLGPRVGNLSQRYYGIEKDLPHLVRTQAFIDRLESNAEPTIATRDAPEEVTRVEFDDVTFAYGDDAVLQGVSFAVETGEFIAFVGRSGAGKSTIAALLARYYEPDAGEIRANDIPIDAVDITQWRDHVSLVRQDPCIFDDTLRYNLTIGNRDAEQFQIDAVCEIAKVDEFLDELPNGYGTRLGDDGVRLSGGQKQRVAIARALLDDPDLLILDEATSDLDSSLERAVQEAIEGMDRDYAIITIAHRLSTIENADRIYTIEDGRIAEVGTHTDLITNDGSYAELYRIQSRG
jgi:subfamily B ATP-binding cassette protein MsbA